MSGENGLRLDRVQDYRARIRAAAGAERQASIVDRETERLSQMIEQRIQRLRTAALLARHGASAHRFRDAQRRLRAALQARAGRDDVGQQQILQGVDPRFDVVSHGVSNSVPSAADASRAAGSPHRLSGDQI